jgi:hypothetical protein
VGRGIHEEDEREQRAVMKDTRGAPREEGTCEEAEEIDQKVGGGSM